MQLEYPGRLNGSLLEVSDGIPKGVNWVAFESAEAAACANFPVCVRSDGTFVTRRL